MEKLPLLLLFMTICSYCLIYTMSRYEDKYIDSVIASNQDFQLSDDELRKLSFEAQMIIAHLKAAAKKAYPEDGKEHNQ